MDNRRFAIIGGDLRQIRTANALFADGYSVWVYGFNKDIKFDSGIVNANSLEEALGNANIVVLPLPTSTDSQYINTPLFKVKLEISTLFNAINKNQFLLLGKADDHLLTLTKVHGIYVIDYFEREELTVLNAIPRE